MLKSSLNQPPLYSQLLTQARSVHKKILKIELSPEQLQLINLGFQSLSSISPEPALPIDFKSFLNGVYDFIYAVRQGLNAYKTDIAQSKWATKQTSTAQPWCSRILKPFSTTNHRTVFKNEKKLSALEKSVDKLTSMAVNLASITVKDDSASRFLRIAVDCTSSTVSTIICTRAKEVEAQLQLYGLDQDALIRKGPSGAGVKNSDCLRALVTCMTSFQALLPHKLEQKRTPLSKRLQQLKIAGIAFTQWGDESAYQNVQDTTSPLTAQTAQELIAYCKFIYRIAQTYHISSEQNSPLMHTLEAIVKQDIDDFTALRPHLSLLGLLHQGEDNECSCNSTALSHLSNHHVSPLCNKA